LTTHKFIPDFFYENSGLLPQTTQPFFSNLSKSEPVGVMPTGFLLGPQYYLYYFFTFSSFFQPGCRLPVRRKSGFFRTNKKGEEHFVFAWGSPISQH